MRIYIYIYIYILLYENHEVVLMTALAHDVALSLDSLVEDYIDDAMDGAIEDSMDYTIKNAIEDTNERSFYFLVANTLTFLDK